MNDELKPAYVPRYRNAIAETLSSFMISATASPSGINATTALMRTPVAPRMAKKSITSGIRISALLAILEIRMRRPR